MQMTMDKGGYFGGDADKEPIICVVMVVLGWDASFEGHTVGIQDPGFGIHDERSMGR